LKDFIFLYVTELKKPLAIALSEVGKGAERERRWGQCK
jgi:hypothetical protein